MSYLLTEASVVKPQNDEVAHLIVQGFAIRCNTLFHLTAEVIFAGIASIHL